jgi:hypothetical protein
MQHRDTDPIIFRGLKSLTLEDTQQQSLLRLASEGISVSSNGITAYDLHLVNIVSGLQPSYGRGLRRRRPG